VDADGQLELPAVDAALERGVAILSAMWVNNEIGVIQDVHRLANRCLDAEVPFHTDAVQAVGKVACSMADFPCTLMAISAHKIGGPKGAGALIVRDPKAVEAIIHGGEQQFGIRPGTENVAGIVGLGQAVEMAVRDQETTARQLADLRDAFERRVLEIAPDTTITVREGNRAPHISSLSISGIDPEAIVMHCDLAGVACSTGSACSTGQVDSSHVLKAIGAPVDIASRVVRFSFYKQNTMEDVDRAIEVLPDIITKVRKLSASLAV
jgi:cysteine desulfurase